ncbi:MAG: hypothetical protein HOC63_07965 [Rhodospirillales bacterium]|nr:hypothetical protein [Rhodospirillales bacterium]MBT4626612.1 hypothetical protein [Rhodospirillales bacterium]MBT6825144.1 hypothetical protein [Rhodospirillales bacterium]
MTLPPASIFEGTDEIIARALELKSRDDLKHKSVCLRLSKLAEPPSSIAGLVSDLYTQVQNNWSGRIPSQENWRLERQTYIGSTNDSPEVLLERTISILADRGFINDWYSQIPVASGLIDGHANKRTAVDLLRHHKDQTNLIELKWESDTPLYAATEILRYGLAYLLAFSNKDRMGYADKVLLKVENVALQVLAPSTYFRRYELGWLARELNEQLQAFSGEKTENRLEMTFQFLAFPEEFNFPFEQGDQVLSLWNQSEDSTIIQTLISAIRNIEPVWVSQEGSSK